MERVWEDMFYIAGDEILVKLKCSFSLE